MVGPHGIDRAKVDFSDQFAAGVADGAAEVLDGTKEVARGFQDHTPLIGQREAATSSLTETETQAILQLGQLVAYGGLGNAQVSEKHCNFLINTGAARAAEIEALGELVRARVLADSGVALDWEIHRIGRTDDGLEAAA